MSKVTEKIALKGKRPLFVCDVSPPRGADPTWPEQAKVLDADFICVAYNPGKAVRLDSVIAAHIIKERYRKEVIFVQACRDMNKLAVQTRLIGAAALGLENVVVLKGDDFTPEQAVQTGVAAGFKPTELITAIKDLNEGVDYKGGKLKEPTNFCVGGTIDLGKGIEGESQLAQKKAAAGADFFLTQPIYDAQAVTRLLDWLQSASDNAHNVPIFFGVQILLKDGVIFSDVPESIRNDLDKGRPGADIALEVIHRLLDRGIDTFYLISPILKGGARDYPTAQQVLSTLR